MTALVLAIFMSSSIALVFRASERADLNRYAVTAVNYLTACGVSAVLLSIARRPDGAALRAALPVGVATGLLYIAAFLAYQVAVRRHGVARAGASIRLGIFLPAVLSFLLFREPLSGAQWAGFAAAAAAIVLIALPAGGRGALQPLLLGLLVLGGLAEFGNKVFEVRGAVEDRALFLLLLFGTAFLASLVVLARVRRPFGRREVLAGIAVGVPNQLSAFFLIRALGDLPAAAVFPVYGAGGILVLALAGAFVFREPLRPRDAVMLLLAATAVALLAAR
ncbi:MAG: EamA family transporter [Planctomycetes bacterium]|nr:EamA family transporter [Planctomycetota bacterium]